MSCCAAGTIVGESAPTPTPARPETGMRHSDFVVPGIHCAGCIRTIEQGLARVPGVVSARVNFSTRRVAVDHDAAVIDAEGVGAALVALGYEARGFDPAQAGDMGEDVRGRDLLRALAVAGFAAGNVMLLSVSVWSGADEATRALFHWISAMIALPALVFAGRPFFRSAVTALRHGRLNMDVPIALAVILAGAMSLHATITDRGDAYFDAAMSLLFFLLIGRVLDHMMRARARSAVTQLMSLWATDATVLEADGSSRRVKVQDLVPGMAVRVAAGERVPADGRVASGQSEIDAQLVTGESTPGAVAAGDVVHAGTVNLLAPLVLTVTAVGNDTFLAEVIRLMEAAESGRARFVRIADRAARIYAPAVHLIALLAFAGWMFTTGGDWHAALTVAVATLIITCPCALGLAVPAVHVVASGILFRSGILLKDGTALERLAEADRVAFDKTGTLTRGQPVVTWMSAAGDEELSAIAGLARQSRHPLAVAVAKLLDERDVVAAPVEHVSELPGRGLEGWWRGRCVRLGKPGFAGEEVDIPAAGSALVFAVDGQVAVRFALEDRVRPDAAEAVGRLAALEPVILSGDRAEAVGATAQRIGVAHWQSGLSPADKVAAISGASAGGHRVLMVGDGINDAPALAAAHVSMAPASASDVGRTAADLVFLGERLDAVPFALDVARRARRLVLQNFALAIGYNIVAVPLAVMGEASPLVAAIAMSTSSILVTFNALRLRWMMRRGAGADEAADDGVTAVPPHARLAA
ncbi:MAG: heavy metal translocating P-type ATPase [Pseudomonadota bacterium]|nr:heavy metal translocating P-type ATPase [Pseudomonadota bacterium]